MNDSPQVQRPIRLPPVVDPRNDGTGDTGGQPAGVLGDPSPVPSSTVPVPNSLWTQARAATEIPPVQRHRLRWRRARSGVSHAIEVAYVPAWAVHTTRGVAIRHAQEPGGTALLFTPEAWQELVERIHCGSWSGPGQVPHGVAVTSAVSGAVTIRHLVGHASAGDHGAELRFPAREWDALVTAVLDGEFDDLIVEEGA